MEKPIKKGRNYILSEIKEKNKEKEETPKLEITTGYYETWLKLGKTLLDYAKEINLFGSITEKSKTKKRPDPSTSLYEIEWVKTSESVKAQLIKYKDNEFWIQNGCFKSELIKKEELGIQRVRIQDWIISKKMKEGKEE